MKDRKFVHIDIKKGIQAVLAHVTYEKVLILLHWEVLQISCDQLLHSLEIVIVWLR